MTLSATIALSSCSKTRGVWPREPSVEEINTIEALLAKADCLKSSQWHRTYSYAYDYVSKFGSSLALYDYTTILVDFEEAAREPPRARSDGRRPVDAGTITTRRGDEYMFGDDFFARPGASASYTLADRRLVLVCSPIPNDRTKDVHLILQGS